MHVLVYTDVRVAGASLTDAQECNADFESNRHDCITWTRPALSACCNRWNTQRESNQHSSFMQADCRSNTRRRPVQCRPQACRRKTCNVYMYKYLYTLQETSCHDMLIMADDLAHINACSQCCHIINMFNSCINMCITST